MKGFTPPSSSRYTPLLDGHMVCPTSTGGGKSQCREVRNCRKTTAHRICRFTTTFYRTYNQVFVEISVRTSDTDFVRDNKSLRRGLSSQQHNKVVVVDAELVALMLDVFHQEELLQPIVCHSQTKVSGVLSQKRAAEFTVFSRNGLWPSYT